MKAQEYDLVAIGGGTAGLVAGAGSSYLGVRAAIVEKVALGGDCLWTGCVPSKALLASAKLAHHMRRASELGLKGSAPKDAFREVMERMRKAREVVAHHDDPERFRKLGVDVHRGHARFLAPGQIDVEGVGRLRSKRFVIATGAEAFVPPIPGLAEAGYLTNATVFDRDELPATVVILGGGPIGLEFAQVYNRLGAKVTVLEMLPQVAGKEDPDVARLMQGYLEEEGIEVVTGLKVTAVESVQGKKVAVGADGRRFTADEILVAAGRKPNTEGLDLEKVDVAKSGAAVQVDRYLCTTKRGIWAAGDVVGGLQFTHVAHYESSVVLRNAFLPVKKRADYSSVPWVTYTDPEIAHVGLSEAEATARGGRTHRYAFADLDRAICEGETKGMVKISADRKGRVLGATIVGASAGELIFPLVLAKQNRIPLSKIAGTIFPYPTRMEGVKRTLDEFQKDRLSGLGGRILKRVIAWLK